jgi:hypothetical protein
MSPERMVSRKLGRNYFLLNQNVRNALIDARFRLSCAKNVFKTISNLHFRSTNVNLPPQGGKAQWQWLESLR